eukprot:GHVS01065478.1.p1 GENE.GHVS01065478.1~~GHVS01065478.1.p1  ORF type:complete len:117 (+),score=10.31 GHVS01065478.1:147-497(+)
MSLIRFPTTAADLKLRAALSLVKRLPPTEIQNTIESLSRLAPEEAESVSSNINSELDVLYDTTASRHFIGCRFNRDVGGVYYRYVLCRVVPAFSSNCFEGRHGPTGIFLPPLRLLP